MFEEGGQYANRIGKYTVLEIHEPRMIVKYEDGTTAELRISVQSRIWENILAEEESRTNRAARRTRKGTTSDTKFFIRSVGTLAAEGMAVPGLKDQVAADQVPSLKLGPGDRIIYYAVETQVFFAVATITSVPSVAKQSARSNKEKADQEMFSFAVDVDASAQSLDKAVSLDAFEFESQPNIAEILERVDIYVPITEDEFELLAESLTEVAVEDEEEEEDDEDLEEEYDE